MTHASAQSQGVVLRIPAQERSDVILTSYYSCYWSNCYYNGYTYSCYQSCYAGSSYSDAIPGAPASVPSDVAISNETNRIFQYVGGSCSDADLSPTGPLCQGSGIKPNTTDPPPSMLGDGPCERPFLEWQVVASAACLTRAWFRQYRAAMGERCPKSVHLAGHRPFCCG